MIVLILKVLKDKNGYLVKFENVGYDKYYKIFWNDQNITARKANKEELVVFDKLPQKIELWAETKILEKLIAPDGTEISGAEHLKKLESFREKAVDYYSDYGPFEFDESDFETEYEYKKYIAFVNSCEKIYSVKHTYIDDILFEITNKVEVDNPYFIPLTSCADDIMAQKVRYERKRLYKEFVRKYLEEKTPVYGVRHYNVYDYELDMKGKVSVYIERNHLIFEGITDIIAYIEDAERLFNEDVKHIKEKINMVLTSMIQPANIAEVISDLETIRESLPLREEIKSIAVKKYNSLRIKIEELIEKYRRKAMFQE